MNKLRQIFAGLLPLGLLLLLAIPVSAQTGAKRSRILFLIDASSSMSLKWNEENARFDVASTIALQIVDSIYSINNEVEFAVRTFGTLHPAQEKNCTDTELEVPFNIQNAGQIKTRLKYIRPIGFSPIAYSLAQAAGNELSQSRLYDYSIIFITDGGESCGGDVCRTYQDFIQNKIKVKPYVIGLDKNQQLKSFYECLGNYVEVTEPGDIPKAIRMIVDANRPLLDKPKQLNLITEYAKPAPIKDTVKQVFVPSKNIFPRLQIVRTPIRVNKVILLNPSYVIVKKGDPVLLRFQVEDNAPKPVLTPMKRDANSLNALRAVRLPVKAKSKIDLQGQYALARETKAVLRFTVDEPVKPAAPVVPRDIIVVPRMRMVHYAALTKGKAVLKTRTAIAMKREKASLRFEVDAPRVMQVAPAMKMGSGLPIAAKSKVNLKGRTIRNRSENRLTLRFEVEAPRQTMVVPGMKMQSMAMKANAKANLKGKKYSAARNKAQFSFVIEEKPREQLRELRVAKYPMRYSYAFRLPTVRPMKQARGMARIAFQVEAPRKRDTVVAKPEPKPAPNSSEFSVVTENSAETMVQVFFTGPDQKAYLRAKPEIEVYDVATNKLVSSFRRDVTQGGPIPQPIKAGTYNIIVKGQNDLVSRNVVIEAGKLNKVNIRVTDGTLSFAYMGNRNRPVEYNAIVNRRFAAGATILQKCADRLNYEPGTYYVEINTLPALKYSIDLTFGAVYEIQLAEPGTLQITNTSPYGKIQLQSVLGDEYLTFLNLNITGNAAEQRLMLQPGPYKAIVPVNPAIPQAGTKIIDFRVYSNKETLLQIQ